jgi:hypothetical protein
MTAIYLHKAFNTVHVVWYHGTPHPIVYEEELTDEFTANFSQRWDRNLKDTLSKSQNVPKKLTEFFRVKFKLGGGPHGSGDHQITGEEECPKCQELTSTIKWLKKKTGDNKVTARQLSTLTTNNDQLKEELLASKADLRLEKKEKKTLASEVKKHKSHVARLEEGMAEQKSDYQTRLDRPKRGSKV